MRDNQSSSDFVRKGIATLFEIIEKYETVIDVFAALFFFLVLSIFPEVLKLIKRPLFHQTFITGIRLLGMVRNTAP